MKDFVKTLVRVLVYSSANREKIALTIKAGFVAIATFGVSYFGIDQLLVNDLANALYVLVSSFLLFISTATATYGALRKLLRLVFRTADTL